MRRRDPACCHAAFLRRVWTAKWRTGLADLLSPFDMFFVGAHCALPELVRCEKQRVDRPLGSAEQDFTLVHRDMFYDLEIQSEDGAEINVEPVISGWKARRSPSTFGRLLEHFLF